MKILPFILLLVLVGCGDSNGLGPQMSHQINQWVPDGTRLVTARQTMEQHEFTCTVTTYGSKSEMPAGSDISWWDNGSGATNVSVLKCRRNDTNAIYEATLTAVNGKMQGGVWLFTTRH